jgi:S1-C subfamily serine protease
MTRPLFLLLFLAGHGASFLTPALRQPNYALCMSSENNGSNGLSSLSVSELKRLLSERGVDFRDCLEKRDLVERLQDSPPVSSTTSYDRLTESENRLIQTFKRVSPSVAYIQTTLQASRGFSLRPTEVPAGTGSGLLWDNRGHVVTNYHVIAAARGGVVKVKLQGMAKARDATVVGVEPDKDLAVLKLVDITNLPSPIDVGTSMDLQVGQSVLAIGNPFGLDDTLTKGIISALGRDVNGIRGCIQTDAMRFLL